MVKWCGSFFRFPRFTRPVGGFSTIETTLAVSEARYHRRTVLAFTGLGILAVDEVEMAVGVLGHDAALIRKLSKASSSDSSASIILYFMLEGWHGVTRCTASAIGMASPQNFSMMR